jgi:hypothetical protein
MRRIATVGTILCATALLAHADTEETRKRLERELRNIPAPELPAYAATIVRNTPAAERAQAAIITVETVARIRPTAASSVVASVSKVTSETQASLSAAAFRASHHQEDHQGGQGNSNPGPGNGNGNGNANGGVGHGPGEDKPGRPIVHDRPINTVLPNGKPRHFPPDPPRRPVDPPRPHKYNKPHPNH